MSLLGAPSTHSRAPQVSSKAQAAATLRSAHDAAKLTLQAARASLLDDFSPDLVRKRLATAGRDAYSRGEVANSLTLVMEAAALLLNGLRVAERAMVAEVSAGQIWEAAFLERMAGSEKAWQDAQVAAAEQCRISCTRHARQRHRNGRSAMIASQSIDAGSFHDELALARVLCLLACQSSVCWCTEIWDTTQFQGFRSNRQCQRPRSSPRLVASLTGVLRQAPSIAALASPRTSGKATQY